MEESPWSGGDVEYDDWQGDGTGTPPVIKYHDLSPTANRGIDLHSEYERQQALHLQSMLLDFDRRVFADDGSLPAVPSSSSKQEEGGGGGGGRAVRMRPDRQVVRPMQEQCLEWAELFLHMRVCGKALLPPPGSAGPSCRDVEDREVPVGGSSEWLRSSSGDQSDAAEPSSHQAAHPVDPLTLNPTNLQVEGVRSEVHNLPEAGPSGRRPCEEEVEEVLAQDGDQEEMLALGPPGVGLPTPEAVQAHLRRQREIGFSPISPRHCIREEVDHLVFDSLWKSLVPLLSPLLPLSPPAAPPAPDILVLSPKASFSSSCSMTSRPTSPIRTPSPPNSRAEVSTRHARDSRLSSIASVPSDCDIQHRTSISDYDDNTCKLRQRPSQTSTIMSEVEDAEVKRSTSFEDLAGGDVGSQDEGEDADEDDNEDEDEEDMDSYPESPVSPSNLCAKTLKRDKTPPAFLPIPTPPTGLMSPTSSSCMSPTPSASSNRPLHSTKLHPRPPPTMMQVDSPASLISEGHTTAFGRTVRTNSGAHHPHGGRIPLRKSARGWQAPRRHSDHERMESCVVTGKSHDPASMGAHSRGSSISSEQFPSWQSNASESSGSGKVIKGHTSSVRRLNADQVEEPFAGSITGTVVGSGIRRVGAPRSKAGSSRRPANVPSAGSFHVL